MVRNHAARAASPVPAGQARKTALSPFLPRRDHFVQRDRSDLAPAVSRKPVLGLVELSFINDRIRLAKALRQGAIQLFLLVARQCPRLRGDDFCAFVHNAKMHENCVCGKRKRSRSGWISPETRQRLGLRSRSGRAGGCRCSRLRASRYRFRPGDSGSTRRLPSPRSHSAQSSVR